MLTSFILLINYSLYVPKRYVCGFHISNIDYLICCMYLNSAPPRLVMLLKFAICIYIYTCMCVCEYYKTNFIL